MTRSEFQTLIMASTYTSSLAGQPSKQKCHTNKWIFTRINNQVRKFGINGLLADLILTGEWKTLIIRSNSQLIYNRFHFQINI